MIKKRKMEIIFFTLLLFTITTYGCIMKIDSTETTTVEPIIESTNPTKPLNLPIYHVRNDGERFEETIILEGMEEKVKYEHIINKTIGFEIDYDYESFVRQSEQDREKFISIYDDLKKPANYLEITHSNENLDTAADSVIKILSKNYTVEKEPFTLNRAGNCIRIGASLGKDGIHMPDLLQMVYVIPTKNGSIIAIEHYEIEASEGFGRRFSYIMNTLEVIN